MQRLLFCLMTMKERMGLIMNTGAYQKKINYHLPKIVQFVPFMLFIFCIFIVCGTKSSRAGAILVAGYDFNEGSGLTALDSTGTFNGTITGATYSADTPLGGTGNTSLFFDGDSWVDIGLSSNFAFSSISLEFWVNATTISGTGNLALSVGQASSTTGIALGPRFASGEFVGQIGDGSNNSLFNFQSPDALSIDTWTHFAVTFDGTTNTGRMYENGLLVDTIVQNAISYATNLPARIGVLSDRTTPGEWLGFIDDVRIYNGVLTDAEISAIANANATIPEPTTVALLGIGLVGMTVYGVRRRRLLRCKES